MTQTPQTEQEKVTAFMEANGFELDSLGGWRKHSNEAKMYVYVTSEIATFMYHLTEQARLDELKRIMPACSKYGSTPELVIEQRLSQLTNNKDKEG